MQELALSSSAPSSQLTWRNVATLPRHRVSWSQQLIVDTASWILLTVFHGVPCKVGSKWNPIFLLGKTSSLYFASWVTVLWLQSNENLQNKQIQQEFDERMTWPYFLCFNILNKHTTTNYSFKYREEMNRNQQHKKAHTEVTNLDCKNSAQHKGTGPHTKQ